MIRDRFDQPIQVIEGQDAQGRIKCLLPDGTRRLMTIGEIRFDTQREFMELTTKRSQTISPK